MSIERRSKGKRPVFVTGDTDENLNRLLGMVSSLAAEVAVLRDRQRTLEKLLEQQGGPGAEAIEAYTPEGADLAERMRWQAAYLERIHAPFARDSDDAPDSES